MNAAQALLLASLPNNTNGTAYAGGNFTSSIDTSASAVGNPVYVAAGGGVTLNAPVGADTVQQVIGRVQTLANPGVISGLIQTPSKLGTSWLQNLSIANALITNSSIDLTTKVTGVLPPANGGAAIAVRNATGVTLNSGPVTISGYDAANSAFNIIASDAGNGNGKPAMYLLLSSLANNTSGTAFTSGTFASGLDTTGSSVGALVYLAVGGGVSLTAPNGADQVTQVVGRVQTLANPGVISGIVLYPTVIGSSYVQALSITNAKIANGTIDLTAKVTGALPVVNGGTGDVGTSWTAWVPAISSDAGGGNTTTFAPTQSYYKTLGKTVWFTTTIQRTSAGNMAAYMTFTLPTSCRNQTNFSAMNQTNNNGCVCYCAGSGNLCYVLLYNAGIPFTSGQYVIISGVYEQP